MGFKGSEMLGLMKAGTHTSIEIRKQVCLKLQLSRV